VKTLKYRPETKCTVRVGATKEPATRELAAERLASHSERKQNLGDRRFKDVRERDTI
jgi:hypothetical protein